jgi:predicted CoA-substrate-specific enzyme activase
VREEMIVAGIDVGHRTLKLVLLNNEDILTQNMMTNSEESSKAAERVLDEAITAASIHKGDIGSIVATGSMGKEVKFANFYRTSMACLAKGVHRLFPEARTIIDLGGETCNVVKIDSSGAILDTQANDKCAAGTGIFFEAMTKLLGTSMAEMGALAKAGNRTFDINSMCVVFAEQEVISHAHENPDISAQDLAASLHASIAERVAGLAKRLTVEEEVILTGGCAMNPGYVKYVTEKLRAVVKVPEDPQVVAAYGAALFARERREK